MTVSWGILLPLGVIVARFYRHKEPTTGPKAWWFVRHQLSQYGGLLLATVGFALAIYMKWHTQHFDSVHAKLGLTVMIIGLLQPLNAFIRPKPGDKYRAIWSFCHKNLGYGAIVLAMPTIFLGLRIIVAPKGYTVAYAIVLAMLAGFYFVKLGLIMLSDCRREGIGARAERISQLRTLSEEATPMLKVASDDHSHEYSAMKS